MSRYATRARLPSVISGAHAILYSADPDADRDFLRDVLGLSHVDVGGGWLIFGLPPSEIAVHPAEKSGTQELYLLHSGVPRPGEDFSITLTT